MVAPSFGITHSTRREKTCVGDVVTNTYASDLPSTKFSKEGGGIIIKTVGYSTITRSKLRNKN